MKNTDKPKNCKLTHCLIPFILLFLLSAQMFAQQETKPRSFSIHAGANSSSTDNVIGASLSFHYIIADLLESFSNSGLQDIMKFESMLFLDSRPGLAIPSGDTTMSSAIGLAVGLRINTLPQKNWNPSFVIMPGLAYASEAYRYNLDRERLWFYTVSAGFSIIFFKKHMVSIELKYFAPIKYLFFSEGRDFTLTNIKYGFWF